MAALRALRPFAHREFRVLISALSISIFGSGMWAVAMVYEVIHLGGGPLELSLVATAASIGLVGFVLAGGIAADRFPQRLLIIGVEGANLAVIATVTLLAMLNVLQLWHLALGAFVLGVGQAFFFPAYSAILPRILPAEDLLAANGMEGTVRPILQQAAGPAIAGILVAAFSPAHAVAGVAACHFLAFGILNFLNRRTLGGPDAGGASSGASAGRSFLRDLREGFSYTVRTPWLLWTLLWACLSVLFLIGPIEVLLPFVVRDQLGGDSRMFGFLLAVMGVGSAVAALATASFPPPPLPDSDGSDVGPRKPARRSHWFHGQRVAARRCHADLRSHRGHGNGHLGHTPAAKGPTAFTGPDFEPGLLCLPGPDACVHGTRRARGRGGSHLADLPGGRTGVPVHGVRGRLRSAHDD